MSPSLLAPDRQDTWTPVWFFEGPAWTQVYATRDIDIPGPVVPGDPFVIGESDVGGDALVGGGAGSLLRQAYGRILNTPSITRRLVDVAAFGTSVEVSDSTVVLDNTDGALTTYPAPSDYRGAVFTLTAYDPGTGFLLERGTFIVSRNPRNRGTFTIEGTSFDPGIPEDPIPKGVVDVATWPLAVDLGKTPTWLFGNAVNLPLLYVRDDQTESQFDYLVCRGSAAAITALRRVTPNGATPFVTLGTGPDYLDGYIELEPYPGMVGVLKNGSMEDWSGAVLANWVLAGVGASYAKNQTAGQFDEGATSVSLTRAGADCTLSQDLIVTAAPFALPLTWWRGRTITFQARVRATAAARARITIFDGVGTTPSTTFHTGGGLFELLSATRTLDAAATQATIFLSVEAGATTAQFDDARVYLKAVNWAEVIRTDLYPGYTAVRFFFRQDDASDSLLQIVGDVNGLQPERNPARAARTMLSDVTHGLGKGVDAASFDQAEIDAAFDWLGLVLPDAPAVLLDFNDAWGNATIGPLVARDGSGHERHGAYHSLDGLPMTDGEPGTIGPGYAEMPANDMVLEFDGLDASYVEILYSPAFDPTDDGWTMEIWYQPQPVGPLDTVSLLPICEKLVGAVAFSGLTLSQDTGVIRFGVNASGGYASTSLPLIGADVNNWVYIGARAANGSLALTLGRSGVVSSATAAYTGTLPSGEGSILIGKYGTGHAELAEARMDKFQVYPAALSTARVAAHAAGVRATGDTSAVGIYGGPFFPQGVSVPPILAYRMTEASGTVMGDTSASTMDGVYVGGPTLAVLGPAPFMYRKSKGAWNRAVSFENDVAKYAKVTLPSPFSPTRLSISCWWKPDLQHARSGIVEKTTTFAGEINTGWLLFQESDGDLYWRVKPTTTGVMDARVAITPEDVGRWMLICAVYDTGTLRLYRNGLRVATTDYVSPVTVNSGDLFIGVLGISGGVHIYPGQGDMAALTITDDYAFTDADVASIWTDGTWYPGGLLVDAALTEPRQAQDWLKQVAPLRGLRFGFTSTGAITCTVDAAAPASILMEARDGAGDGERTLLDCRDRQRPALSDAVRDLIVNYRRDLLSGAYLRQLVRPISTALDAQGNRIGRDRTINLDAVREDPSADRFASYMAALLTLDETVAVTLGPEARALREGMLVQLTDLTMGYIDELCIAKEVTQAIDDITAVLGEWDEQLLYEYRPGAFPVGASSG